MIRLLTLLIGWIPAAYANTPTLDKWGTRNPAVARMWEMIRSTVYVNIGGQDLVHALTGSLVQLIFTFIVGASTLLIMYAGIRMIASRGKEDEFTQGKTIITWALIGLVLAMLARVIISFFADGFFPAFFQ